MSRLEVGPGDGKTRPKLIHPSNPSPDGLVLMLHGGDVEGVDAVGRLNPAPAVVRSMTKGLRDLAPQFGFARLLNAVSGWNDGIESPVADARWALMRLRQDYPDLPIAVVGHSMGGRTAFEVATEDSVKAVVGLAPWLADAYDAAPFTTLSTMIVHGRADTMTDHDASADLVRRIKMEGGRALYLSVPGLHGLVYRRRAWQRQVAGFLSEYLPTDSGDVS